MTNAEAQRIIQTYISELPSPSNTLFRSSLKIRSLCEWAAKETLTWVIQHPKQNPVDAVEDLCKVMDKMACSDNPVKFTYSVGYDVAMDILDTLLTR